MAKGRAATVQKVKVRQSMNGKSRRSQQGRTTTQVGQIKPDVAAIQRVFKIIKDNKIQTVDLKFNDLPGLWQHFSIPVAELSQKANEGVWADGIGFDGSSIRGFQKIQESDMNLFPDPSTAVLDPACTIPTLSMVCDIYDPITRKPYSRDPRFIAKKAEEYLKKTGIADVSYWGPEPEFFIINDVRFD